MKTSELFERMSNIVRQVDSIETIEDYLVDVTTIMMSVESGWNGEFYWAVEEDGTILLLNLNVFRSKADVDNRAYTLEYSLGEWSIKEFTY